MNIPNRPNWLWREQINGSDNVQGSNALLDGVRKFVNVRELDIDLIDRINPSMPPMRYWRRRWMKSPCARCRPALRPRR